MRFSNRYRKITTALLIAGLLLPAFMTATAEDQSKIVSAKGMITSPAKINLLAPMGGRLKDFSWKAGDRAEAGQVAAEVLPAEVDAANDGVISGLNAKAGDQAEAVQAQYGALCYVERQGVWHVKASTASAYDKPRNRDVRVGDMLRVYKSGDEKEGQGTVISVDGKDFTVEMEKGDFELEDDVKLYLGAGSDYKNTDLAGKGEIARPNALAVTGAGVVASVLVKDGDTVARGQPLFLMDASAARYGQPGSPQALFPQASLIEQVLVTPGQNVAQGQALMVLIPEGTLEATLQVDELDIAQVRVGQRVKLRVDAYPDDEREGAVQEIRPIGNTELDTTKYDVRVSVDQADGLLLGMHVTGYPGN